MTSHINTRYPDIEVHHFSLDSWLKKDPFVIGIEKSGIELPNPELELTAV